MKKTGFSCMQYYLAPMEGITTYIYRSAFAKYFGGIDKYYTPFLASMHLSKNEKREVLPENNEGIVLVPQILTNRADEFVEIARALKEYGYREANLNLGCPSGTVVSKHRGAGFLAVPKELDAFLQEIFEKSPIAISIKTRIGISDEREWDELLRIYEKYPIQELIVHTRLQKDFYKEPARPHTFRRAQEMLGISQCCGGDAVSHKGTGIPLCYNGDIVSPEALAEVQNAVPDIASVMLGRGLIADPNLIRRLRGLPCADKDAIGAFMETLLSDYTTKMSGGERVILYKMKEIWVYLGDSFTNPERYLKRIKKANRIADYTLAVRDLLREQELKTNRE